MADKYYQVAKQKGSPLGAVIVAVASDADAIPDRRGTVVVRCHHSTSTVKIVAEAKKLWQKKRK